MHPQSRGIVLALNQQTMTASLVSSFVGPTPLLAASQGDLQPLSNGNWMVGWGQEPWFSEYSPTGQLLLNAGCPRPTTPTPCSSSPGRTPRSRRSARSDASRAACWPT